MSEVWSHKVKPSLRTKWFLIKSLTFRRCKCLLGGALDFQNAPRPSQDCSTRVGTLKSTCKRGISSQLGSHVEEKECLPSKKQVIHLWLIWRLGSCNSNKVFSRTTFSVRNSLVIVSIIISQLVITSLNFESCFETY